MMDWVASIASNVVGGLLVVLLVGIVGATVSTRGRWLLTGLLGRLLGIELDQIFSDSRSMQQELAADLNRAREVAILAGRGNELQRDPFHSLFAGKTTNRTVRVRVLLPETESRNDRVDWIGQREGELKAFDASFQNGLLRRQIEANVDFLRPYASYAEVRLYGVPHFGRLILTERCAYLTFYRGDAHGRECQVYRFNRGDFYDGLARLFELTWQAASKLDEVPPQSSARTAKPASPARWRKMDEAR